MLQRILVWDVPTRVFHWTLALSFAGAYLTAESERYRDIHLALGYLLLGMIAFRLVWGFVGTAYARFAAFVFKPVEVVQYMRSLLSSHPQHYLGHNPAGAVAIFLLLALGSLISISGLGLHWEFGDEDIFEELHEIAANLMLLVVFVHIAGVLISSVLHKENLVRAMFTGYKQAANVVSIPRTYAWLGVVMALASAGFLIAYLGYS
ncbi:cytochrome b/b6 domain-containing protein [Thiothrix fructosivorans]|uniref:Cytochrome b/b6 domain-containing protein n=1 Tax=Thiothrix fructosivorans TaxID=111770 RepID=A0A8B0SMR2_9GAMM|nr:cytochrome b/b6 domain-containing protein [Thiothrix fructosivorans]MBO0614132.1 cytochrome b/b6 domain-containing protein [Thiothrix fructosivorans]QTX12616.1 cytochrome b/b6 domain-containing protein [Thiothrix fructosivorans]